MQPAIESTECANPEAAIRKLLLTSCEMLNSFAPRMGGHQRAIHGGGVFNDDFINEDLKTTKSA